MTGNIDPQDVDPKLLLKLMLDIANGDAQAMYELGYLHYHGRSIVALNFRQALEYFSRAAELGHVQAMFNVGVMYEHGQGVPPDGALARKWMQRAGNAGLVPAMMYMGHVFDQGRDVERDYAVAIGWYEKAAEAGDMAAQNIVGDYYAQGLDGEQDYAKALEWYLKAAKRGFVTAQNNLAHMYFLGKGVTRDFNEVQRWWCKAAKNGQNDAQYNLGNLYMGSYGPYLAEPDYEAARLWLQKAVDAGHAEACADLGAMYKLGLGVDINENKAKLLYHKGAYRGSALAMAEVGVGWLLGCFGASRNFERAEKWLRRAVKKGNSMGQCYLGVMYRDGKRVERDLTQAAAWFMVSMEGGYEEAVGMLEAILPRLSAEQLAEARKLATEYRV